MLNWIVLAYLFFPGKRVLLRHLLVSLYFWAGILKLDWEWLSGVALYNQDRLSASRTTPVTGRGATGVPRPRRSNARDRHRGRKRFPKSGDSLPKWSG